MAYTGNKLKRFVAEIAKSALFTFVGVAADVYCAVRGRDKNLILFESYDGEQASGSPRAIYDYLRLHYGDTYRYMWALRDGVKLDERVQMDGATGVCAYKSFGHIRCSTRAAVLVCDTARSGVLPRPRGQLAVNTWHGTSYKNLGGANHRLMKLERRAYMGKMKRWDYFMSGSTLFSEVVIRKQLGYPGEILLWGTPRNDMLINSGEGDVRACREHVGVRDPAVLLALYAPTWRDSGDAPQCFDTDRVRVALEQRFGRPVVLAIRSHHSQPVSPEGFDIDLSDYEDVREVMLAADVLISDYSSIVWDYSVLGRPLFLYCPDIHKYEHERGFILSPVEWGFLVAEDSEELIRNIDTFDPAAHGRAIAFHHELYGMYEDGHATERIAGLITGAISDDLPSERMA